MQSKTTRGVRHLLVATGVISLVLSVAAPAALASDGEATPEALEVLVTAERDVRSVGVERIDICHPTGSETNPELDLAVAKPAETARGHNDLKGNNIDEDVDTDLETTEAEVDCAEGETTAEGDEKLAKGDKTSANNGKKPAKGDETSANNGKKPAKDGETPAEGGETPGKSGETPGTPGGTDGAGPGQSDGDPGCGHDDNPTDNDQKNCGDQGSEEDPEEDVKDVETDPVVVKDPGAKTPGETEPVVEVKPDPPVTPAEPALPLPEQAGPKPVVIISTDTVTKPVPAVTPANRQPEVLGSVTTRIPGSTTASVTALAATGTSTTTVLAALGSVLLLAGLGLQLVGRRQAASALAG